MSKDGYEQKWEIVVHPLTYGGVNHLKHALERVQKWAKEGVEIVDVKIKHGEALVPTREYQLTIGIVGRPTRERIEREEMREYEKVVLGIE